MRNPGSGFQIMEIVRFFKNDERIKKRHLNLHFARHVRYYSFWRPSEVTAAIDLFDYYSI